jgi:hypothetical protein
MSNWERLIATKARHGSFTGSGLADEDAYYEFFADTNPPWVNYRGIVVAIFVIVAAIPRVMKVTFSAPATKLFR